MLELAASHETLVTLEENAIMGGAASGVNELADGQTPSGAGAEPRPAGQLCLAGQRKNLRDLGLDAAGIQRQIETSLAQ
ncbi:hypothetical protein M8494_21145 [Serratia ureilytica]